MYLEPLRIITGINLIDQNYNNKYNDFTDTTMHDA